MKTSYMTDILFRAIDEINERGVLENKKIVLFGLNAPAFACKQYLQDRGIEIFAYVDNNAAAVGLFNNQDIEPTFHHLIGDRRIRAYSPGGLPREYIDEYVFLLYSKYEQEMIEQLDSMGYKLDEQVFVMGGFWKTENMMKAIVPNGAGEELTWNQEKKKQIEAVKYVFKKCKENDLRCYLNYGTLIGAVRHHGYIPWDDDMDLSMPAEDMNKLLDIIKKENGRYDVHYSAFNNPCRHFVAKIEDRSTVLHQWDIPIELYGGMVIDIFPLGGLPGDKEEAMAFFDEVVKHGWEYDNLVIEFPEASDEIIKRREEEKKWILDAFLKYPFDESEYVFTVPDKPGNRVYPRRIWDEYIHMEFEGETFLGPAGYDEYLNIHYGGYMNLPPENRRVSNHRNKIFENKNNNYPDLNDSSLDCIVPAQNVYSESDSIEEIINNSKAEIGRKTLLYYISLSDIHTYKEVAIGKYKSNNKIFYEAKDKLSVIWVMEDSFIDDFIRIAPDLYNEFEKVVDEFKKNALGEIISINNINQVLDSCDAYYGAGGYAMYLCMEKKMPVMQSSVTV